METNEENLRYLNLLSDKFKNIAEASTEIINLQAILNLPKGTEHFITDVHGEYEAFNHILKNASGVIRRKVNDIFKNELSEAEQTELCTLIYYPEQKIELVKRDHNDMTSWYRTTLFQLIDVCQNVSSKYTRSKVRKALPADFSYIIQELLHESEDRPNKYEYFNAILNAIIETGRADNFIAALSQVIQRLTVDSLHIIGDIYDRGPGAHLIMDTLEKHHNYDIQWGNHDILWMGAAAGCDACIANVIRISMRYANMETLEDGYGINLLPLATFAMETYGDDDCSVFRPKLNGNVNYPETTLNLMSRMHKAISIIQFKLEHDIIRRRPEFAMSKRDLLDKIDYAEGTITIDDVTYQLKDNHFPTIDPNQPYTLTDAEVDLIKQLHHSFTNSDKLDRHMRCMYTNGSLYLIINSNLLYHASVPLNEDGSFRKVNIEGVEHSGKDLLDEIDRLVRQAYFTPNTSNQKNYARDFMWYLWCGPNSPLFDKDKMTTFERYFIAEKSTHKEQNGHYYSLINNEETCISILKEFGIDTGKHSHIINGHVPVKVIKGETPIRANGRRLVIDGGFSKAYQAETGIAGFTLTYNSYGLQLIQHQPFESTEKAINEGLDIISSHRVIESSEKRMYVKDTDKGKELIMQINDLQDLMKAYRSGIIAEKK